MYRLVALDLDGTLLSPQKTITPRTYAVLQRVKAAGIQIVIATGQMYKAFQNACAHLELTGPQIIYNGALIIDMQQEQPLYEKLVPPEYILSTLELLQSFKLYRGYHTHENVYVDLHTPGARYWYPRPVPPVIELADITSIYPQPCIKLVAIGSPLTLRQKRDELVRILADQLYVTQAASDLLEFLHPAVSKGNALRALSEMLNITPDEILAIGDNHNDVGMLQFAGIGIAMGNAHDEIKAIANYVTSSNAQDGVALALEKFLLPQLQY